MSSDILLEKKDGLFGFEYEEDSSGDNKLGKELLDLLNVIDSNISKLNYKRFIKVSKMKDDETYNHSMQRAKEKAKEKGYKGKVSLKINIMYCDEKVHTVSNLLGSAVLSCGYKFNKPKNIFDHTRCYKKADDDHMFILEIGQTYPTSYGAETGCGTIDIKLLYAKVTDKNLSKLNLSSLKEDANLFNIPYELKIK